MKTLLALLLLIPSLSWGNKIKPITEIVKIRDMMDKTTYLYLGERCAGLYLTNYRVTEQTNTDVANLLLNKASGLIKISKLFHNSYGIISDEEIEKIITDSAIKFGNIYSDLFEENWYENGAYFQGTFIEEDLMYCNSFMNDIKAAANQ